MQKLMIALTATAALVLCGSVMWAAQATPLTGAMGTPSQEFSPIEKVGCTSAGETCPYGYSPSMAMAACGAGHVVGQGMGGDIGMGMIGMMSVGTTEIMMSLGTTEIISGNC